MVDLEDAMSANEGRRNLRSGVVRRSRSWRWVCFKVGRVVRRCIMMNMFQTRLLERDWGRNIGSELVILGVGVLLSCLLSTLCWLLNTATSDRDQPPHPESYHTIK